MDLCKNGKLLRDLRKEKNLTQRQVAQSLNICAKTVSKWETGHGFPDVSTVTLLAQVLGVSSETILSGNINYNMEEIGNMKRIKFYMCPECGNVTTQTGNAEMYCCGKKLYPLEVKKCDENHVFNVDSIENDCYITFNHEMSKGHYICFVACVKCDRVFIIRLYPESDGEVRFPKIYGGKLYCCCSKHGLYEIK